MNHGNRRFEGPICKYAKRGSPRPHPALLVSSSTKWSYAVVFDISTVRILEAPGGEHPLLEVPLCEYAMRVSPRAHPTLLVSPCTKWKYAVMVDVSPVRISEAPGDEYRLLEVPICENAMRGSLALHYARLRSSRTKTIPIPTAIV